MTKVRRWYNQVVTFTKLKAFIGLIAVGSEVAVYADNAPAWAHGIVILSSIIVGGITVFIEDKNKDGIADVFQNEEDLK